MQLYSARVASLDITPAGFSTFLRDCIERMSSEHLRASLCHNKDGFLYEADYQKQFYAAASAYLPAGFRISPEVGQVMHARCLKAIVCFSLGWAWVTEPSCSVAFPCKMLHCA